MVHSFFSILSTEIQKMAGAREIPAELLDEYHDLSSGFVLLHAPMCLNNFVEVKNLADLDVECTCSDLLDQFFERHPHEVF